MKKYITGGYGWKPSITEIIIERETDLSYWVNGERRSKDTRYSKMFNTFQDAKNFMLFEKREEIERSKRKTQQLSSEWDLINKLKEQ